MWPEIKFLSDFHSPLFHTSYCRKNPSFPDTSLLTQVSLASTERYSRVARRLGITEDLVIAQAGEKVGKITCSEENVFLFIPKPEAGWEVFWEMVAEEMEGGI